MGRVYRMEVALEHRLLERVLDGDEPVGLDAEDGREHLVVERLPELVDGGQGVVQDEQGLEVRSGHAASPAVDRVVARGLVELPGERGHRLPHHRDARAA